MPNYTAAAGDCINSIAAAHGLFWQTVWDHPANAALRQLRQTPNVLAPGDTVFVPDKRPQKHKLATGARHSFKLVGVPVMLRLKLQWGDEARAGEPYVATIDGVEQRGRTDAEGGLALKVPPAARNGILVVGEGDRRTEYALALGQIDPADSAAGAIERLRNLGWDAGPPRTEWDDMARAALKAFQRAQGLPDTGDCDAATQARLRELHDGS